MDENLYSLSFPLFPASAFPYPCSSVSHHFTAWLCDHVSLKFFWSLCPRLSLLTCLPPSWFHTHISPSCMTSHLSCHLYICTFLLVVFDRYYGDTPDNVQQVIMATAEWWGETNCRWKSSSLSSHLRILSPDSYTSLCAPPSPQSTCRHLLSNICLSNQNNLCFSHTHTCARFIVRCANMICVSLVYISLG